MNLPNILTLVRVVLIPLFVIFLINKLFAWALVTFAIAGITDGIDGMIARVTHKRTELGSYLDPIADKLLLMAAFVTLAIMDIVPSCLAVIVIARDAIILIGFLVLLLTNYRPEIQPSFLSKVNTFFQISTILLVLMANFAPVLNLLSTIAVFGTGFFTIASGSHYIYVGTRILNEKK